MRQVCKINKGIEQAAEMAGAVVCPHASTMDEAKAAREPAVPIFQVQGPSTTICWDCVARANSEVVPKSVNSYIASNAATARATANGIAREKERRHDLKDLNYDKSSQMRP